MIIRTLTARTAPSLRASSFAPVAPLAFTRLARPITTTSPRAVASSISNKPGSQSLDQAALNVKEELGNAGGDVAKAIAGANYGTNADTVAPTDASFLSTTARVAGTVPKPVMVFGLAGGLPYVGASIATGYLARQAGLAAAGASAGMDPGLAITILHQALEIQATYGAVMLSFLGALHWGMEFAEYGGKKGYARLALGAAPVLYAWPTLALDPVMALLVQWFGFTGMWWADWKATGNGWTPRWYSQYRFYLSFLVGTCIIGSVAATSWWGPVGGHGLVSHELDELREERRELLQKKGNSENVRALPADAPITTVLADEAGGSDEAFVVLKKRDAEEEGKSEASEGEGEGEGEAAEGEKKE
ncbi:hypothetical protein BD626DRAFT_462673 [Schizophyllum amplum]|uniref:Uncharacterized protein n=1 Tax=Schizophyllum amplum TaxID=97359 RepID=A0A550C387_9AGAR|nr:hypothetical protein BD626DRAFT_462673 [Auriculariopsis ampla]